MNAGHCTYPEEEVEDEEEVFYDLKSTAESRHVERKRIASYVLFSALVVNLVKRSEAVDATSPNKLRSSHCDLQKHTDRRTDKQTDGQIDGRTRLQ